MHHPVQRGRPFNAKDLVVMVLAPLSSN